ncbi:MAG: hypothetical protein HQK51_20590, partial [Oligoflexia bacterium]|nr:hypothetical protein [Oligoflexia bacterium]
MPKNFTTQFTLSSLKKEFSFSLQQTPPDGLWKESALFNNDTKLEALTELRADLYCKLGVRKNASMDL